MQRLQDERYIRNRIQEDYPDVLMVCLFVFFVDYFLQCSSMCILASFQFSRLLTESSLSWCHFIGGPIQASPDIKAKKIRDLSKLNNELLTQIEGIVQFPISSYMIFFVFLPSSISLLTLSLIWNCFLFHEFTLSLMLTFDLNYLWFLSSHSVFDCRIARQA